MPVSEYTYKKPEHETHADKMNLFKRFLLGSFLKEILKSDQKTKSQK